MLWEVVPGTRHATGTAALREMLADATVLRIAVAFVTRSGVEALDAALNEAGRPPAVQAVVRATHTVAETADLLALEDVLEAEVRAVVGAQARRFHPKAYMTRSHAAEWLLSGSGNLTVGGLGGNDEQFELLRIDAGVTRAAQTKAKYESVASNDIVRRWAGWWDSALPLSTAMSHPAFLAWQASAQRRSVLAREQRAFEAETEAAEPAGQSTAPPGLNTSREATEQKVTGRMLKWFPDARSRRRVYSLMAEAITICAGLNPDGWWCGYVTDGAQGDRRLTVCARNAQVLVAHQTGEVYFTAPPASHAPAAFELCLSLGDRPGVRVVPSHEGQVWGAPSVHPYAQVPASSLAEVSASDASALLRAAAEWRMADGRAPHWQVHSPAMVRATARAVGTRLSQPSYEM